MEVSEWLCAFQVEFLTNAIKRNSNEISGASEEDKTACGWGLDFGHVIYLLIKLIIIQYPIDLVTQQEFFSYDP